MEEVEVIPANVSTAKSSAYSSMLFSRYAKVILHVVLYPPQNSKQTFAANSMGKIPTLVLLPYLLKSIEEYAEDLARTIHAHPTLSESLKEAALSADGRGLHSI